MKKVKEKIETSQISKNQDESKSIIYFEKEGKIII
jgi:hypothetical protein